MSTLLDSPAKILAAAARLRETAVKDKTYRQTPIGAAAGRYLDELAFNNYSDKTVENREQTLAWLALDYAHKALGDVDLVDLQTFLATHWRDAAVNTRAMHVSALRTFFEWCHEHDLIARDPARKLRGPRQKDTERRAHSEELVRKLVVAQPALRDRVGLLVLYWCGLRREELRLIQFRHIDLANRLLTVFGKGGRVLEQNIPEPLGLELERLMIVRDPHPDEYLLHPQRIGRYGAWPAYSEDVIWEDRFKPMAVSTIAKWWERCVARANLTHFPMHELRHTAGTHFHQEGHDLVATQHFMRHANPATTARTYVHLDRVRAVADVQRRMVDPLGGDA